MSVVGVSSRNPNPWIVDFVETILDLSNLRNEKYSFVRNRLYIFSFLSNSI